MKWQVIYTKTHFHNPSVCTTDL